MQFNHRPSPAANLSPKAHKTLQWTINWKMGLLKCSKQNFSQYRKMIAQNVISRNSDWIDTIIIVILCSNNSFGTINWIWNLSVTVLHKHLYWTWINYPTPPKMIAHSKWVSTMRTKRYNTFEKFIQKSPPSAQFKESINNKVFR